MTEILSSSVPTCARLMWCDHSSLYLSLPHLNGGPPYIMTFPLSSSGLASALDLLKDARNSTPPVRQPNLTSHPAIKRSVSNKVAHDILKKMRMI